MTKYGTTPSDLPNIVVCTAGTRMVEVPRVEPAGKAVPFPDTSEPRLILDTVSLIPCKVGGAVIFAGYHGLSDTWFIADDAGIMAQRKRWPRG